MVPALIRLLDRGTLHLTISSARMSMKSSIISLVWPADRQNLVLSSVMLVAGKPTPTVAIFLEWRLSTISLTFTGEQFK